MNNQKLEKWKKWIGDVNFDGSIVNELVQLGAIRAVYSEVVEIVRVNQKLHRPSAFYRVYSICYTHSVLMYIRRQVRLDKDGVSLIKLLYDLRDNSEMISVDYYVGLNHNFPSLKDDHIWDKITADAFRKHFAGSRVSHLDPAVVDDDIARLDKIHDACKHFIDKRIAHLEQKEPQAVPQFKELESWCEEIDEVFRKYYALLFAIDYQLRPVLSPDWKDIFVIPWITPNNSHEDR